MHRKIITESYHWASHYYVLLLGLTSIGKNIVPLLTKPFLITPPTTNFASPLKSPPVPVAPPLLVVERANPARLQEPVDAVVVVGVSADAPGHRTTLEPAVAAARLTLNAHVHQLVAADHADVDGDVPGPEGYGAPGLHQEAGHPRLELGEGAGLGGRRGSQARQRICGGARRAGVNPVV